MWVLSGFADEISDDADGRGRSTDRCEFVFRRDMPEIGTDWLRSKNAPGFTPLGPYLVPVEFVPDPSAGDEKISRLVESASILPASRSAK